MTPFFIALQFLTRLKIVNQTEWSMEDFGKSVATFPYVGLIIGIFLTIIYFIFSQFLAPMPLMLIIVISEFLFTGGLHADGLMDTSDGLFSGREREKKLEIMKDSRVGSFGVVAFIFVTLLKWQLFTAIPVPEFIPIILLMMPLMSRYTLILSIRSYPYARKSGMGQAFALYAPKYVITWSTISTFCMPIFICLVLSLLYAVIWGITSLLSIPFIPFTIAIYGLAYALVGLIEINIFSMIMSYIINRILNHYIVKQLGGTTGDTYGFVVELTEILLLLIYIITLTFLSSVVKAPIL
ncbi:adenosylcobinamide-GDP ribazoletransferase [Veillonella sp. 27098_8_77]|uniref:adenosylcobinamide-GDP ribazoletransferase n=1 Tax=Veillonella sp. 27098_8_77 TaxID=3003642 RepID=UPI00352E98F2